MIERGIEMRCYYCDGHTDHTEHLGNTKIPVCDDMKCQQEYYDAEEDRRDRNRKYDEWITRSE